MAGKQFIFFFFICFIFTCPCPSQTIEETLDFARWNHAEQRYAEAAEAYERILFFEKRKDIVSHAHLELGHVYLAQKDFSKALESFNSIDTAGISSDSIFFEAEFGKILCYIFQNDPHYAMISLIDLKGEMPIYFLKRKKFFTALVNFRIDDFTSAEAEFLGLVDYEDTLLVREIFNNLEEEKSAINPRKAKILSMILPGAGQLYLKDYKNAAKSFFLNAAIITAGVHFAAVYTILDAYLFTSNWFFRYYKGGFLRAQVYAENKISSLENAALGQLLELTEKSTRLGQ